MKKIREWLGPHKNVRLLQLASFMRHVCQGIAVVDVSLYLKDLGWSGGAIGGVWVGTGLFRTVMVSLAGPLHARLGAKHYMILFEMITAAAALIITLSRNDIALCSAIMAAGFGRGHAGSGGPVSPIERGWLAAYARRFGHHVFGVNSLLVYAGMGIGSILASLPPLWERWLPGAQQYRPLFALMLIITLVNILVVLKVKRVNPDARLTDSPGTIQPTTAQQEERTGFVDLVNGIAVTLSTTMTSYWLSAKYAASSGMIGLVMAVSYLMAGEVSLANVSAAKRFGSATSVICMQAIGIVFALALPWAPWFWLAAVCNVGCVACNLGARGNRSIVMMDRRNRRKRTWQSRTVSFVLRLGTVLWPGAFGHMIEEGQFALPFTIAAAMQAGATFWYGKVYRSKIKAEQEVRKKSLSG
ncbi:MFS transporter [Brevibacillus sp. SYP-B805]|uniref:MFS transporter n=1 Tax=Brevibacillus sp. SYP-B805 TaxID=1578199 RepID=UPI0013EA9360|nr:MFS transporter [Brevibacillus sp. SYP-B805]NGQ94097.1 MFS transporter [Brevibacillus sp. SYP-B805]